MNWISVRKQPDPVRPGLFQMRQIGQQPGIQLQIDGDAVPGNGGDVAQGAVLLLPAWRAGVPFSA